MKNRDGRVIYVGKSRRLCARVASYFTGTEHAVKTARMVAQVADFDYILCDSEIEALSLENTLIKKYAPRYNIRLKDAKSYPYIAVSGGAYPRIFVTRDRRTDGTRYFGPYSGMADAYANVDTLRKLFRLPTCHRRFPEDIGRERPCIYRQMGRCMAPCAADVTEKEYGEAIGSAVSVLSGNTAEVERRLRAQMLKAAEAEQFEAAARARDAISSLARLRDEQKVLSDARAASDVWALAETPLCGVLSVLSVREGKLIRKNDFTFPASAILTPEAALAFIADLYAGTADIPRELLFGFPAEEESLSSLADYLSEKRGARVSVRVPLRGDKRALCEMAEKNAKERAKSESERTVRDEGTLVSLASLLSLEVLPERIEVYDISGIGKEHNSAGMIVYEDGALKKNAYRTFRIREVAGDDYGAMKEVLSRRFAHKDDEDFGRLPDLILLDGGKTHVAVGREALREAGLEIPLFGLVKDDHHKTRALCTEDEEVGIAHEQAVFVFLYKLQEEVHRYALSGSMGAKRKTLRHSSLEKISGVGAERARRLLAYFGTLHRVREASVEELSAVRGMTKTAASAVYAHFHKEETT